jgi:hypothetical protein
MNHTKLLIGAVAATVAFAALQAQGQNLTATLNGISPGLTLKGTWNNGEFVYDYPAGVMNFTDEASDTDFSAFCVEPLQGLSYEETLTYQVQNPLSLANYDTIARLVGGYIASTGSDQDAAAVQWAIWEVTTESLLSQSLFDGSIRIIGPAGESTALLANQYLANVKNYTPVTLTYLRNESRQDVVSWNVVPEPASAVLAGLSGLVLLRRRRA